MIKNGYRLACRQHWSKELRISVPRTAEVPVKTGQSIGLAIDIGTTVIKTAALDLKSGMITGRQAVYNPQNNLGGDVLTRVTEALNGKERVLRAMLNLGIAAAKKKLGLGTPARTVIVGNPVMISFYLNRSLKGYARHPFNGGINYPSIVKRGTRRIFPVIGGFVGGDTLAGLYALENTKPDKINRLYIDLGTNGEVVIMNKRAIWATSTAAGPAFEGTGISCGSLAIPGAIDRVFYDRGFQYHKIGRAQPVGFCASGLIDLLAAGLDSGHLAENGRLLKPIRIAGLSVSQEDIRILQLAIAALHTGIRILMDMTGLHPRRIDEAVITGEFGRNLNLPSLIRIGIIPAGIRKIRKIADLPLRGAVKSLLNPNSTNAVARLKAMSRHVDLARQPDFQDIFVSALRLAPWN